MAAPPRGEALRRLDAWLRLGGARFPLLRLEADGADAGACVRAVSDAPADTELLAVPRALLISSDEARAGSRVCAAVAAAGVVLSAPRNCDLAIFILEDGALRPGAASRHRAYYDALPRAFPGSPSFWSAAELAALLTGSPMVSLVAQRSAAWRADYDAIAAVAPEWPAVATPDEWAWARAVVASRNFAIRADGKTVVDALVPLADMLNHRRPRQTWWGFNVARREFVVNAVEPLVAGHEVFDSYGKKSNSRYLLNYGFCVEENVDPGTGRDCNELRLLLRLRLPPADPDPHFAMRLRVLGDAPSSHVAMLSASSTEEGVVTALGFLRFAYADERELLRAAPRPAAVRARRSEPVASGADGLQLAGHEEADVEWRASEPLSLSNEARVLAHLARACRAAAAAYPTTLADDEAALSGGALAVGSNARNARVLVRGEKRVCAWWVAAAAAVADLLDRGTVRPRVGEPAVTGASPDVRTVTCGVDGACAALRSASAAVTEPGARGAASAAAGAALPLRPPAAAAVHEYVRAVWQPLLLGAVVAKHRDADGGGAAADAELRAAAALLREAVAGMVMP